MYDEGRYFQIIMFEGVQEFKEQIKADHLKKKELINMTFSDDSSSLLEEAIAQRKVLIANYLLDAGAPVNVITKENYNEFHIIAPYLSNDSMVAVAERILKKGCDLSLQDKKYHNTAMFSIALSILTHQTHDNMLFLNK